MKVLIIGGTGLISRGIVKHLLARGSDVTVFTRAKREKTLRPQVKMIVGGVGGKTGILKANIR